MSEGFPHVMVIDDSAVVRRITSEVLRGQGGMQVTTAPDPYVAQGKIQLARPDVLLLDVEMPRKDGITFLREIMEIDPMPVVIYSGFAERGTRIAIDALSLGAVDVVCKPRHGIREFLDTDAPRLIRVLRGAAEARLPGALGAIRKVVPRKAETSTVERKPELAADSAVSRMLRARAGACSEPIVAIGASTGGPQALEVVLGAMPGDCPPIVVVQHMPPHFTAALAKRLDAQCEIEVREARNGDRATKGTALVAPGDRHLEVERSAELTVRLSKEKPVNHHRPSVDVLFRSLARNVGPGAIGVLLTGMGSDGAAGLAELQAAGAATVVQDEATSVVFGMPRQAIALGAADSVVPLDRIARTILEQRRKEVASARHV